jgi:hypothetical protein
MENVTCSLRRFTTLLIALACGCGAPAEDRVQPDSTSHPAAPPAPAPPAQERLPVVDSGAPVLLPRDEADTSFQRFRTRALQALSARDTSFLYGILAPDIKNSFGGDDSIAGFKRIWRMAEGSTAVWDALARVLQMGGRQQGDTTFIAPYVYAFWPDSVDPFEHVAVVTPNATVHEAPAPTARAIGTLSHSVLKLEEWQNLAESGVATDSTWARVRLPGGRTGWVRGKHVYSPVGWRAFFVKRDGRWIMQLFVAGD